MLKYLAVPYSHQSRRVENARAKQAAILAGKLIKEGNHIICPVVMCHPMNRLVGLGGKFEYWREFDELMLSVCFELWVAQFDGWKDSVGITAEIRMAERRGMTIRYVNPTTLALAREPFAI